MRLERLGKSLFLFAAILALLGIRACLVETTAKRRVKYGCPSLSRHKTVPAFLCLN
jgi:hypothetical protein